MGFVVLSKWRVSLTPFRYGGSGTSLRLTRVLSQTGHVGIFERVFPTDKGRSEETPKEDRADSMSAARGEGCSVVGRS